MVRTLSACAVAAWAVVTAALAGEKCALPELKVGDKAPPFKLAGTDGKEYTLEQLRGKSAVVLAWYPKAMTPGCTTECKSLRDESALLDAFKVQVFGISVDGVDANKEFAKEHSLRFPLLSDPEKTVAQAYGVLGTHGMAQRWTFVIDHRGIIRAIDKEVKPAGYGKRVAEILAELGIPKR